MASTRSRMSAWRLFETTGEIGLNKQFTSAVYPPPAAKYNEVRSLPGVKKVFFSRPPRLLLDSSAQSDHAGLQGFTAFRYSDGVHQSAAGVPVDSVPRQHLLFSHVAHQVPAGSGQTYLTGIALLNPFGTTIDYTMEVFDGSGHLVAQRSDVLAPHQKVAKILSYPQAGAGFFTQTLALSRGHDEVVTSYGVLGFELFFTQDLSLLASVPAQIEN